MDRHARRSVASEPLGPARTPVEDEKQDRLLDVRQAARLLGVTPGTLYQWAYKRRIPVVKLFGPRGALRFRLHDVQKLIQDSLRPARRSAADRPAARPNGAGGG